jgi:F-type H+-transporting ATPase subunit b
MNLNATLFGQMITFALFVWFTMKFVWPHITRALAEREQKIVAGLNAAERGVRELELAKHKAADILRDSKIQAAELLDQANKRAAQIMDEAKETARTEGQRLLTLATAEINNEVMKASQQLRQQVAAIAVLGAEKILERNVDVAANEDLLEKLTTEIYPRMMSEHAT